MSEHTRRRTVPAGSGPEVRWAAVGDQAAGKVAVAASMLFAVLAAGQLALVGWCGLRYRRTGDRMLIVPAVVCAALGYDNAIVAAGRWIGVGGTLETLSVFRFVAHLLLTPLLMPWACAAAGLAGVLWLRLLWVRVVVGAATLSVIALGVFGELTRLTLRPAEWAGTLRYTTEHSSLAGILPPVVTVVVVLVAAVAVWRVRGYRLWTVTTVTMTVVSAAMPPMLLTNAAELAFMGGVAATAVWLSGPGRMPGPPVQDRQSAGR
ncbi:hypothetical protein [Nocardia carnea]|uniref:hypothetical protein n=1 Tax=Nocardia carnea TaxID=37328 RepID=UPI002454422C|nr:hypothetical protein [Nocardia carnea]